MECPTAGHGVTHRDQLGGELLTLVNGRDRWVRHAWCAVALALDVEWEDRAFEARAARDVEDLAR